MLANTRVQSSLGTRVAACMLMAVPIFPQALSLNALTPPASSAKVAGSVVDRFERPLANVLIVLPDLGLRTITDGRGNFDFSKIPEGAYTLVIDASGYLPQAVSITIDRHGEVQIPIVLHASMGYAMT